MCKCFPFMNFASPSVQKSYVEAAHSVIPHGFYRRFQHSGSQNASLQVPRMSFHTYSAEDFDDSGLHKAPEGNCIKNAFLYRRQKVSP